MQSVARRADPAHFGQVKTVDGFDRKLDAALTAASLSRVAVARELGVDKSLVGRWLSGAVRPTEHNFTRLVALVAQHRPELRPVDWYDPVERFRDRLGLDAAEGVSRGGGLMPALDRLFDGARAATSAQASAYEGFWRTSRRSVLMPDTIFHDYGLMRRNADGLLDVVMGGAGLWFEGHGLLAQGNLFVFLHDRTGSTPISVLFRGVALPRAMVLDGILALAALDASRTPAAVPIVMERVGDLTGERAADDARIAGMAEEAPQPLDPVAPAELGAHLARSAPGFLTVPVATTLSRGAAGSGLRG